MQLCHDTIPQLIPQVSPPHLLAASTAGGGIARQFRVQFHFRNEQNWRMYGSFRLREQAEQCIDALRQDGLEARLVRYAICPTAA